jgi:outer membrane protein assembly factor BamB
MTRRSIIFSLHDKGIVVTDLGTGEVLWAGRPLGYMASEVLAFPSGDRAIVLLDYSSMPTGPAQNLICIGENGEVLWRSPLPTESPTDAFTAVRFVDDRIIANSWSGFRSVVDPQTGELIERTFVK